jgi:hypothetical protein
MYDTSEMFKVQDVYTLHSNTKYLNLKQKITFIYKAADDRYV